ncbi:hypothetical protein K439DRAFT_1623105 [Ramaria rubella]|nr:hypothetical protein K439DRAFT_1623105 [Ramaria rubella]
MSDKKQANERYVVCGTSRCRSWVELSPELASATTDHAQLLPPPPPKSTPSPPKKPRKKGPPTPKKKTTLTALIPHCTNAPHEVVVTVAPVGGPHEGGGEAKDSVECDWGGECQGVGERALDTML